MTRQPEMYRGEALDSAMMLARLDYEPDEIAVQIGANFPLEDAAARRLADDAVKAVTAERAES